MKLNNLLERVRFMNEKQLKQFFKKNEVTVYLDGSQKYAMGVTQENLRKTMEAIKDGNYGRAKFLLKDGITNDKIVDFLKMFCKTPAEVIPKTIRKKASKLLAIADYFYSNQHTQIISNDDLYKDAVEKLQAMQDGTIDRTFGFVPPNRDEKTAKHLFENLSGTIDKIFGVRDDENEKDSGKKSFEWFINRPFKDGLRNKGDELPLLISPKIDGVPVEMQIDTQSGKILSAITRGDAKVGVDLSELYKDRQFDDLSDYFSGKKIGVKFEQVLTFKDLEKLSDKKDKKYKNVRNGLGAILRDKKGAKYAHFIKLIPLEIDEKSFTGEKTDALDILSEVSDFRLEYTVLQGTRKTLIEEFDKFQQVVLSNRAELPYQIDGIVIEYLDKDLRKHYGRKDRTWDYQRAFKFPSSEQQTTLIDVDFGIGHTGKISMTAIYKPVDFGVCIARRASIGSYKRFKELNLHKGDKILVGYNNDVIPYIKQNLMGDNKGGGIKMPEKCPVCDNKLAFINESENDLYCVNKDCPAIILGKLINFLNRLGVKDLNEKTVRKLYNAGMVKEFADFFTLTKTDLEKLEKVKEKSAENLLKAIQELMEKTYSEAEIVYAISLNDIGKETAELVLSKYNLDEIMSKDFDFNKLKDLDGFGKKKAKRFKEIREYKDTILSLREFLKIKNSAGKTINVKGSVVFSGFRNKSLENLLEEQGYRITDSVNAATKILFVRDKNAKTGKIKRAKELGIQVIEYDPDKSVFANTNNMIATMVVN